MRFAGYGVEYCGAEEISHLTNDHAKDPDTQPSARSRRGNTTNRENGNGGNGSSRANGNGGNGNGNGGENGRITNKQLNFIVNLGKDQGLSSKELDKEAVTLFGVKMNHLTVRDASSFINELRGRAA